MKNNRFVLIVIGIFLVFTFTSCDEYMQQFDIEIDPTIEAHPSLVAPLVYGSVSLIDVLDLIDSTGLVELTEDSLIYIYYSTTAYSVDANDLISLPNSISQETYIKNDLDLGGFGSLLAGEKMSFAKTELLDFELEAEDRVDSVLLSGGFLDLDIFSEFRHTGVLTISSPHIFDTNRDTLAIPIVIGQLDGNFVYNPDDGFDLSGYKIEVSEEGGIGVLRLNFLLELTHSGNDILEEEECGIEFSLRDLAFSHLYGFVAEREVIDVTQSMDIEFYEAVASIATITFKDPQFNLYVNNSYGIPVSLNMDNVRVRASEDKVYHDLIFNPGVMPFEVEAPTVAEIGETVVTQLAINSETSNIVEIIEYAPDMIEFGIEASTGSSPGGEQNFMLDTSKMEVEAELILPMWLKTSRYSRSDTVELDLAGSVDSLDFIDQATLKLKTTNELPFELFVQVYFMDESYVVLDSLFTDNKPLLEAAPVDGEGKLDRSSLKENILEVTYTGEQIGGLSGTKYMKLKIINASTTGDDYVKFFSYYKLNYSLTLDADFSLILDSEDIEN